MLEPYQNSAGDQLTQRKHVVHTQRMVKGCVKLLKDVLCDEETGPYLTQGR